MGFCVARISTFLEGTGNTLETFGLSHQCHAKKILNVIGSHDALPFCLLPFFSKIRSCQTIESPKTEDRIQPPERFCHGAWLTKAQHFFHNFALRKMTGSAASLYLASFPGRKTSLTAPTSHSSLASRRKKTSKAYKVGPEPIVINGVMGLL